MLETLLSNCDLDLVCMQKIINAVDDVLYSLPQTMTTAILVHQQVQRLCSLFALLLIFVTTFVQLSVLPSASGL